MLQNLDPDTEMVSLLEKHSTCINYLAGSVLNPRDLKRAVVPKAQACILLTNKKSRSSFEDQRNILSALSIKKYVYGENKYSIAEEMHNMKIILQLIKPESKNLYNRS